MGVVDCNALIQTNTRFALLLYQTTRNGEVAGRRYLSKAFVNPINTVFCCCFRVENAYVYKGSIDCLRHTVRTEGFFALYKGFVPIYVRMVRADFFSLEIEIFLYGKCFYASPTSRIVHTNNLIQAPWSLTFWVSYEKIRYVTGASSF
jgi:hypothetical protein